MKKISNQLEAEVCNTFKTSCISQKLLAEKYSLSNASVSRILQRNGLIEPSMARSQKKYRDKLISQNLCTCCAQPALEESRLCLTCWFKRLSSHTWGITSRWIDLYNLFFQQGGKCIYSGRPLTFFLNASLDHKIPKSKGGTNDISNLQFVHYNLNLAKRAMSEDEFLSLIKDVAIHQNYI